MSWISTLTCLVIPLLIVLLIRRALAVQRERTVLRNQHPNEPWLWRRDWAARTAVDASSSYSPLIWLLAGFWTLISFPVFFVARDRERDAIFYVFIVFPIVGVILLCVAIYQTLRRFKYGTSLCRFAALPIPLGRPLQGEIETRVTEVPANGFLLRLTCVHRVVQSSGKSTSVHEKIRWQEEQRVGTGGAMPNPNGVRVPFRFALPVEADPADETDSRNRVIWRLEVTAEVLGIDYRGVFELPVFTKATTMDGEAVFAPPPEGPWTPPPSIAIGMADDGAEKITMKPSASLFDWFFYIVFLGIWFGALWVIRQAGGPIVVVGFFALIGGFVLFLALDAMAGRSIVSVNRTQLTSRRTFFGTRVIPGADIAAIEARIGNTSNRRATYDLEARLHDGRSVTIARYLRTRRDAEHVAERITRALGK